VPATIAMDYIKELDIRLDKEYYYAGEVLAGKVVMDTTENFKLKCEYIYRIMTFLQHCVYSILLYIYDVIITVIHGRDRVENNR
jgi:hypothetical protein